MHKILSHCGEVSARLTGRSFGYEVIGKFETCEACSVGKARQKKVNKEWKGGSMTPGEIFYVDISSIQGTSFGGTKSDDYFRMKEHELDNTIDDLIKELRNDKVYVVFI